jgi:hypothetical protein
VSAFVGGFHLGNEAGRRGELEYHVKKLPTFAQDIASGELHKNVAVFEFLESFFKEGDSSAGAGVTVKQVAIAPDGAVAHLERVHDAGGGVFKNKLLIKPAGKLTAEAHGEVVIVLPVVQSVEAGCNEGMKLNLPFRFGVAVELSARYGNE